MAADPDWDQYPRPCLYRAFDQRWIYWADWMVDWPRTEVNQHLIAIDNLTLIARRQMLPTQPCNFFWVSSAIPLDGVIRSDNRGSESSFPLFLTDPQFGGPSPARANFSKPFLAALADAMQLEWQETPNESSASTFGPLDLFYYMYAQLHSAEYRRRYADWLRIDFPRVFVPRSAALFRQLSRYGEALVAAHTVANKGRPAVPSSGRSESPDHAPASGKVIEAGYPRFRGNRIELHAEHAIEDVSADVWEFRAGSHQVCRKWWRDREGRDLQLADITAYQQLVDSVRITIQLVAQVDQCISSFGGWPDAFSRPDE